MLDYNPLAIKWFVINVGKDKTPCHFIYDEKTEIECDKQFDLLISYTQNLRYINDMRLSSQIITKFAIGANS